MISGNQITAARAMLKWTQADLSEKTDISTIAIKKIESGTSSPRDSTLQAIIDAFDRHGIEFIDRGVREKSDLAKVLVGETGIERFYNELATYMERNPDKEVLVYSYAQDDLIHDLYKTDSFKNYRLRMQNMKDKVVKAICRLDDSFSGSDYITLRALPDDERYTPLFYFVYGQKLAMFTRERDLEILVINNYAFSELFKKRFYRLWDRASNEGDNIDE